MKPKEKTHKYYKKPQVSQVKLEIEDAVLAACKATVAGSAKGGAGKSPCKIGLAASSCQNIVGS
ncbi:MAG: hypothetical protein JRC93_00430 [Deltaproteobacteria bacterium]|nr:hypothetical protein [Deltaproteobacteria bacterium]